MRDLPPSNSSERREIVPARLRAEVAQEEALSGICTSEQAERAIDQLENVTGGGREFSRIYLGAHYPGDVLTGGVAGATLARGFRRMMREFLDTWSERTRGGLLR